MESGLGALLSFKYCKAAGKSLFEPCVVAFQKSDTFSKKKLS